MILVVPMSEKSIHGHLGKSSTKNIHTELASTIEFAHSGGIMKLYECF